MSAFWRVASSFAALALALALVANVAVARAPTADPGGGGTVTRSSGQVDVDGLASAVAATAAVNYQGLWWNPNESGWGINFAHQGDTIFATWFTYDAAGKPWWLIALLTKTTEGAYTGPVSTVAGPHFNSDPFGPPPVESEVGAMTVTFADATHARVVAKVNGKDWTRDVVPQAFGPLPTCTWGAQENLALASNYTDLWWNAAEPGWGVNLTHQGDTIFATWFTYDAAGRPWWLIAVLTKQGANAYSGNVATVTGPPWDALPWTTPPVTETTVGTATITFANGNNARFNYTVNGSAQTKAITRQVFNPPGTVCDSPEIRYLARVEVPRYLEDLSLAVYADLEDGAGTYYALVVATRKELDAAKVIYRIIDEYQSGSLYLIALEEVAGARAAAGKVTTVLYDDGEHIVVRARSGIMDSLSDIGFDLFLMSETPINYYLSERRAILKAGVEPYFAGYDAKVAAMLNAVAATKIKLATEQLSGEQAVVVGNESYTFTTRDTTSGTPIDKATQYVYEQLKALQLSASYAPWSLSSSEMRYSNRNVIGEIKGQVNPNEVVIMVAHLDSISEVDRAPGADDDASGCVALLTAAEIMSKYTFKRTVRFVFTTGEEQGTLGSKAYAAAAAAAKEQIVGVLNLDMIGYSKRLNPPVKPKQQIKIRHPQNQTGNAMDKPIADTYVAVVKAYGMDQVFDALIEADGELASDQAEFWYAGYPAAWAIEYAEKGFLNPEMHGANDKVTVNGTEYLNLEYYTGVVKAALGTTAHMAGPL